MSIVHADLQKRAYFKQEALLVVETKPILSDISTKLVSKALTVYNPITNVTAAKNSSGLCVNAVGTATVTRDSVTIDRRVSNSIKYCDEELSYSNFNQLETQRADLYASMVLKLNINEAADLVAEATPIGAGTTNLSTDKLVQDFLLNVKNEAGSITALRNKVDGARTVRGKFHNKPFVAAGVVAFATIQSSIASKMTLSTIKGIDGDVIETPYGVAIVRVEKFTNNKQLVWGTGGAFVRAFREDNINVDVKTIDSLSTAGVVDGDIQIGDEVFTQTGIISMAVMTKNKIFSNVQSLVSQHLML